MFLPRFPFPEAQKTAQPTKMMVGESKAILLFEKDSLSFCQFRMLY